MRRDRECTHVGPDGTSRGAWYGPRTGRAVLDPLWPLNVYACLWCGARLPYPPANDAPAAVQVEIRAAELATGEVEWTPVELDGGCLTSPGLWPPVEQWQAGHLAMCIASHDPSKEER